MTAPPVGQRDPVPAGRTGRRGSRRLRRASAIVCCLLAITTVAGCGGGSGSPGGDLSGGTTGRAEDGTTSAAHAHFRDSGVDVDAWLSRSSATRGTLAVLLTPDRDFHVYSLDLPDAGIGGLGRPTKIRLLSGLTALGRPVADRPVEKLELPELGVVLPVYPAGPVKVTIPVQLDPGARRSLTVSYAACSAARCQPPVADHPLELPAS